MSINKSQVIAALSPPLPQDVVIVMLNEYQQIKQQFFLRRYAPSELNGGRFAECIIRLIELLHLGTGNYTPIGTAFRANDTDRILNIAAQNSTLPETIRFYINRLTRVLLDIRNKRDVAHVGGQVSPNYSDSLLVCHCADWILTDLVRHYHNCSIESAKKMVDSINEVRIPIVTEIDGFVRVQDTTLTYPKKTLIIMYYKNPDKVRDNDLFVWAGYSNPSLYKRDILGKLHNEVLIHYSSGLCTLTDKGIAYVEKYIPRDYLI